MLRHRFTQTASPHLLCSFASGLGTLLLLFAVTGCTSLSQWWQHDLKVGPEYCPPDAPVGEQWIDAGESHVSSESRDTPDWWRGFHDPMLEQLVRTAYEQNLSLQAASWRVVEERAQRDIAAANLFPQTQNALGNYTRQQFSHNAVFPPPSMAWAFGHPARRATGEHCGTVR